jgi:serine phosphatase RsbU (regulator of sigma subunit)
VPERGDSSLDVAALLDAVEAAPPVAAADVFGAALADAIGAREVSFLIADFSGHALIRLGHSGSERATRTQGDETAERVPLGGTPQGRAVATQAAQVREESGGTAWVFAPVTNRGEPIGVLELWLPATPDDGTLADVALAAHALAYVIIANRRFTDLFEWGQRSVPLSLAAEIQHRLLPGSYTCEAGQFTLAAWLEPAADIAGDTFDFALDRDTLHISITDAMGHGVDASLLATAAIGALRNARRRGVDLAEQARLAHEALAEHAGRGQFVTGQLVRIDLATGTALTVNAGHPPPLRLRAGRVERVALQADPPFGTLVSGYRVQELSLADDDRLVFVTDGLLERNAADLQITTLVADLGDLHPRETVQRLTHAVLEAGGGELEDDATALCLDWHGGPPRDRRAGWGADPRGAAG